MKFWRRLMDRAGTEHSDAAHAPAPEPVATQDVAVAAPPAVAPPSETGPGAADRRALEIGVIEALSTVYDPEIPVNIYELGLIYDLDVSADGQVKIAMTLTSPACPVAGSLPGEVEAKVRDIEGVTDVAVELVWDPPWTPDRMTEAARLELGFM
jgi:FeS assembly SUF system protein